MMCWRWRVGQSRTFLKRCQFQGVNRRTCRHTDSETHHRGNEEFYAALNFRSLHLLLVNYKTLLTSYIIKSPPLALWVVSLLHRIKCVSLWIPAHAVCYCIPALFLEKTINCSTVSALTDCKSSSQEETSDGLLNMCGCDVWKHMLCVCSGLTSCLLLDHHLKRRNVITAK